MTTRITPGQIKQTNRQQVYHYLYTEKKVSQQDISYALRLSRPTVAAALAEMEEMGMVRKNGQLESDSIGRKAAAYSVVPDYCVAIGVEIMSHVVKIMVVDLYGQKLGRVVHDIRFGNDEDYFHQVSDMILQFISSLSLRNEQILGVGFAIQGLVSGDGKEVVYGKILDCTGLKVDVFTRWLPYPCCFVHDPDAAAISELWCSPGLKHAYYLSLSLHLGGSMIQDRQVLTGRSGRSTVFEHLVMDPDGAPCYCGMRGCMETICSMNALLQDSEAEPFFEAVRSGRKPERKRWDRYLENVGRMIAMLRLVWDVDVILGGHLAPWFREEDLKQLYTEIRRWSPFGDKEDFLHISKMPSHNITVGAALVYIRNFLEEMGI